MVIEVFVATGLVLTVKVAVVALAATITLAGTWAAAVLLLDSVTVAPPTGAGPFSRNRSRVLPDRDSDCRLTKQVRRYIGAGQFGNHESPYAG